MTSMRSSLFKTILKITNLYSTKERESFILMSLKTLKMSLIIKIIRCFFLKELVKNRLFTRLIWIFLKLKIPQKKSKTFWGNIVDISRMQLISLNLLKVVSLLSTQWSTIYLMKSWLNPQFFLRNSKRRILLLLSMILFTSLKLWILYLTEVI